MPASPPAALDDFQWKPCPDGQRLLDQLISAHLAACPDSAGLAEAMTNRTGTRFFDWIDHMITDRTDLLPALEQAGFSVANGHDALRVLAHQGAIFPRILADAAASPAMTLKVESVAAFLAAHGIQTTIEGLPFGPLRQARAWGNERTALHVIERRGDPGFLPSTTAPATILAAREHLESFQRRRRSFPSDEEAFAAIHDLLDPAIALLGRSWTAALWFEAERDFWMRRNRAGRVQKARQDALGLGWANHDHHTYRCRRATFARVIAVFEKLGCVCRERFYAGAQAGWGAQILEQPAAGIVIFADVDMDPSEITGDFSHAGFPTRTSLGTIGLWCELHGESMLEAGLHHLECQFDFEALRAQMEAESGIGMMKAFTDFAHLRQQFTAGERWAVDPVRLDRLQQSGQITPEEADRFRSEGAVGSHLENLERNDGFKGFNQTGINEIIRATDPRALVQPGQAT